MKKIALLAALAAFAFADVGTLVKVVDEKRIEVKTDGKSEVLLLEGIVTFREALARQKDAKIDQKVIGKLESEALSYAASKLKPKEQINYQVVGKDERGERKIWVLDNEYNYYAVRDGYSLADAQDLKMHKGLRCRLTTAMGYAKNKKLGLWGKYPEAMEALAGPIMPSCDMMGR